MVFGPKTNFFGLKSITDRYSHKEIWRKRFDWLVYFFIIRPRKKNPRRPKSFWILDSTFSLFLLRDLRQSIFRLGLRSTTSRWFTLSGPRTIRRGKDFWWVRKRSHFRLGLFGHYKWRTMVGREPLPHQSVSRSVRSAGHWFASQGLWCTLRVCDTHSQGRELQTQGSENKLRPPRYMQKKSTVATAKREVYGYSRTSKSTVAIAIERKTGQRQLLFLSLRLNLIRTEQRNKFLNW